MTFRGASALLAILMGASVVSISTPAGAERQTRGATESQSTKACFQAAGAAPVAIAMPKPGRLSAAVSLLHWSGTITLKPPPATASVISPSSIWKAHPTTPAGSRSQLFLAFYTASVPAALEPDGTLRPLSNHVLSWVLLTQHEPFDTAGISGGLLFPNGTPPPTRCTFVGRSITAWNAVTGAQLQGSGFNAPSHPSTIHPKLTAWR